MSRRRSRSQHPQKARPSDAPPRKPPAARSEPPGVPPAADPTKPTSSETLTGPPGDELAALDAGWDDPAA